MRNFIISLISLALIVSICYGFHMYSDAKTKAYDKAIETLITEYVNENRWDEASEHFQMMQDDWNKYKHTASFFLDSSSINHIDSTFKKIHYYISADDRSNASGELAYLKGLFAALHKNESVTLENIF